EMKIIVMFLSVIVLVSSGKFIFGAVNTMKISNLEERNPYFQSNSNSSNECSDKRFTRRISSRSRRIFIKTI
ncbi:hypothetical protein HID58_076116, partial [Brassica napus]